jgi:hypothetical protein
MFTLVVPKFILPKLVVPFLNLISALKVKVNKELRLGKGWGGYWHEKGVVLYLGKVRYDCLICNLEYLNFQVLP